ncbi:MFS transporter [Crenobacter intestini]|uniref:MFS transporter n=1 Tax=Crenobacter intestini TaxID=2563443 RepID=A0A4T0V652_9NEIS|nr:MFS transporter [Crenobacter intestini]TIC87250.1 MFS transporter [Crenobacter intestini]
MQASFSFFSTRRFLPLFSTQFLGAFNDNLLKTAIVVMISYQGLSMAGLGPAMLVNVCAGVFILPYFLFSASAGKLSEKIDKAVLARAIKLAEILIMVLAAAGFWHASAPLLIGALFLMGVHSTFFGPLKYSVLPQYLKERELVGGNGLIEMGTFLAILLGQIGGSVLIQHGHLTITLLLSAVAIAGYAASRAMPPAPPASPEIRLSFNIADDTATLVSRAWRMRDVRAAILGISWFWLMGSVYTTQLPTFTRLNLGGDADVYTLMLALFSLGIGLGSVVCAKLSQGRLQLGLVLVGSAGMSVFGLDLALAAYTPHQGPLLTLGEYLMQPGHVREMAALTLLGFFGGFFTVPLYTWLQTASPDDFRSQAIAVNNIVNGLYMVLAAALSVAVLALTDNIALLLAGAAVLNLLASLHLVACAPRIWQERIAWFTALKRAPR